MVVGSMLVSSPSPVISSSARNRRSEPSSPRSMREIEDDMCGRVVSNREFKMEFFYFQKWMNSMSFCYFCVDLFRAPKIMKFLCDFSVMFII